MLQYVNGYCLYPILEKLSGRDIRSKLAELVNFQGMSVEEKLNFQKTELYKLLLFCKSSVPYYQDLFKSTSFDIEKINDDVRYFYDLPVLTKEIVKEHFTRIMTPSAKHPRKTGGSTGQSVHFFYDQEGLDWSAAINLYCYEILGKKPHHKDCHIGADIGLSPKKVSDKLKNYLKLKSLNRTALLITSFADQDLDKFYRKFSKVNPFLVQGHPSTLYALASYIEKNGIEIASPLCRYFEPSGEMLTEKIVSKIESVIGCKVANRYGNAEFGVVAHTVDDDSINRLKVFDRSFLVEECDKSHIIATSYTNYGMPLLRYNTGDIATVKKEQGETYLYDIQGRVHDKVPLSGKDYPTHYIMDFLDHKVGGVREFQIILKDNMKPVLNIVPEKEHEDIERISKAVNNKWPDGFYVEFISNEGLQQVGWRQKFRHVIDLRL